MLPEVLRFCGTSGIFVDFCLTWYMYKYIIVTGVYQGDSDKLRIIISYRQEVNYVSRFKHRNNYERYRGRIVLPCKSDSIF